MKFEAYFVFPSPLMNANERVLLFQVGHRKVTIILKWCSYAYNTSLCAHPHCSNKWRLVENMVVELSSKVQFANTWQFHYTLERNLDRLCLIFQCNQESEFHEALEQEVSISVLNIWANKCKARLDFYLPLNEKITGI